MAIARALLTQGKLYLDADETLWKNREQCEHWRGFRLPPETGRPIDTVPPAERRAALVELTRQALSVDADMLLRAACLRLTGGSRFTQPQRQLMQEALDQVLQDGCLVQRAGRLFMAE